jgi:hypothetical protein
VQTATLPFEHVLIHDYFEPGFYQCLLAHMKGVDLNKGDNVPKREFARRSLLLRGYSPAPASRLPSRVALCCFSRIAAAAAAVHFG